MEIIQDSVTRFTHSSCTGAKLSGIPKAAVRKIEATSPMFEEIKYLELFFCCRTVNNRCIPIKLNNQFPGALEVLQEGDSRLWLFHQNVSEAPNHRFHVLEDGSSLLHCCHNGWKVVVRQDLSVAQVKISEWLRSRSDLIQSVHYLWIINHLSSHQT